MIIGSNTGWAYRKPRPECSPELLAQLPVDDIPGWFFATNGYFSLPMKGLENFFALVHDVTGAPW